MLEFIVARPGGKQAAAFLGGENGRVWLAHTGRVHRNRQPGPRSRQTVKVGGLNYFLVSVIGTRAFFGNLLNFHASRQHLSDPSNAGKHAGPDPGASKKHPRDASDVDPKHSPIVKALRKKLGAKWTDRAAQKVRPDIFVESNDRKLLFEVKPDRKPISVCTAIGQFSYYSHFCKPDRKVLVLPLGIDKQLGDIVEAEEITIVSFTKTRTGYDFNGLDEITPSNKG